jgi:hypothetical protein
MDGEPSITAASCLRRFKARKHRKCPVHGFLLGRSSEALLWAF